MGSDWEGKFDFLKNYCNVVYLPRTEGISTTQRKGRIVQMFDSPNIDNICFFMMLKIATILQQGVVGIIIPLSFGGIP